MNVASPHGYEEGITDEDHPEPSNPPALDSVTDHTTGPSTTSRDQAWLDRWERFAIAALQGMSMKPDITGSTAREAVNNAVFIADCMVDEYKSRKSAMPS